MPTAPVQPGTLQLPGVGCRAMAPRSVTSLHSRKALCLRAAAVGTLRPLPKTPALFSWPPARQPCLWRQGPQHFCRAQGKGASSAGSGHMMWRRERGGMRRSVCAHTVAWQMVVSLDRMPLPCRHSFQLPGASCTPASAPARRRRQHNDQR